MRNLILAATALAAVGAVSVGSAVAQPAPLPNPNIITTSPQDTASGNAPAPGTMTVFLKTRLWTEMSYGTDTAQTGKTATGTPNGFKSSGVYFGEYLRIYPGFMAVAANGLEYGANVQFRQDSALNGSQTGSVASGSLGNTFYVRTAEGYAGTPTVGRFYFGETFSAVGKMMVGTMEDFDLNGGFNGDVPVAVNGNVQPNWSFYENSGNSTSNKIVYVSPRFAGFDIGASFAPNFTAGDAMCGQPSGATATNQGCSNYSSYAGQFNRQRNIFDVAARYKGSFGPVAVAAQIGYIGSGFVNNSVAANTATSFNYRGLDVIDGGATVDFAGFRVGGHYEGGTTNAGVAMMAPGQIHAQNFVGGVQKIMGNFIVGVQYLNELSGGTYIPGSRSGLHERGVIVGGSWDYAPGAILYASAMYVQRSQAGADLLNGGTGAFNNRVQGRGIQIGNRFNF